MTMVAQMRSRYLLLLLLRSSSFKFVLPPPSPAVSNRFKKMCFSLDTLNTNTLNIKRMKNEKKNVEKKKFCLQKKKKKKKTKHRTHRLSHYTFATRDIIIIIIIMVRSSFALFLSRAVLPCRRHRRFLAAAFHKRGERERESVE